MREKAGDIDYSEEDELIREIDELEKMHLTVYKGLREALAKKEERKRAKAAARQTKACVATSEPSTVGGGRFGRVRSVEQMDRVTGVVLKRYASASEAANAVSGCEELIVKCCRRRKKETSGFTWRYGEASSLPLSSEEVKQEPYRSRYAAAQSAPKKEGSAPLSLPSNKTGVEAKEGSQLVERRDSASGEVLRLYGSLREAAISTKIQSKILLKCCQTGKPYSGCFWRLVDASSGTVHYAVALLL